MSKLMIIAGEASGDLHGGKVALELRKILPDLEMIGTGGKYIHAAKTKIFYRVEDLAVIGFWEVLKNYSYYKDIFDNLVKKLDEEKPDAVFLVDYAGFNLKFAAEAKKRGIKVIFYVAPQVWAWKKKRIKKIQAYVDELIVLFPFEVEFFKKEGMTVHCFGHPLLDIVKPSVERLKWREDQELDPDKPLVSLLPGSRRNEIMKHLPLLLQASDAIHAQREDIQFVYPLAPTISQTEIHPYLRGTKAPVKLVEQDTYNAVASSDFAAVASGTATLETAILETPLLIFYKVALPTFVIGRYMLGLKTVGLPNIVMGEEKVPEMVQHQSTPEKIAEKILHYLNSPKELKQLRKDLGEVRNSLGELGAYQKTAEFLANQLK